MTKKPQTETAPTMGKGGNKTRKLIVSLLLGGAAGFAAAYGFMSFLDTGLAGDFGISREIAGLTGLIYVLCGIFVMSGVVSPALGAKYLNVEDADELLEMRRMLALSTGAIILMGLFLIVAAFAAPGGPIPPSLALAFCVGAIAVAFVLSRKQMKHADELMRAMSLEGTATAFYLLFAGGGGWVLAAHLRFISGPQPLDWLTMFGWAMLLGAFWASGRRGMLTPR